MTDYRFHIYRPGEGYLCDDPHGDLSWYVEDFTNPFVCAFSSPSDARDHMATNDTICVSADGQLLEPIADFDGAPYPDEVQEAFKVRSSELLAEIEKLKEPISMLLYCPECGWRHIDDGEFKTKPHHTHACQHCGHCWRPAICNTVGVQFLPGFKDERPAWGPTSMSTVDIRRAVEILQKNSIKSNDDGTITVPTTLAEQIAEALEKTRAKLGMEVRSFVNDLPPIRVMPFTIPPHDEVDPDRLMKAFVHGLERPRPPTEEQRAAEILAMASTPSSPTVKRSEYLADSRRTFDLVETTGRVVVVDDETGEPCFVLSIPTTPISFSTEVEPPTPSQVERRELNVHVELGAMVSDPAFRDRTGANAPEPPPRPSKHPAVWDLVLRDIEERDKAGAAKYGTRLQPHNGRRPLVDAYQDALDLVVYLRQEIYERYGE